MARLYNSGYQQDFIQDLRKEEVLWPELKKKLIQTCMYSKHIMVTIFDIQKKEFLGCSNSIEHILGYQPATVKEKGWRFWYNLIDPREADIIRRRVSKFIFAPTHSVTGTIYLKYHIKTSSGDWRLLKHELVLLRYQNQLLALNYLYDFSEKEIIEYYFENTFSSYQIKTTDIDISDRECEVLKLIANGFSSKQIADKLFISDHTVTSHRKNLIEKFQVHNTAHLVKRASEIILL